MSSTTRNVIIVGSGPAGYTAAVYAARADLAPLVFEGSVTAGGALMTTTEVENFPGFRDGIMGPALMNEMRAQAERFGAELVADDIVSMDLTGDVKVVTDGSGNEHRARAVVLAMGSGYRKLGIDREEQLSGHGVSWCATCDGFFFRDQHIAVVGGGDTAVEEATFLSRFAAKVTLIHRRDDSRVEDHAGPRVRRPEDRVRLELRRRGAARRRQAHRRDGRGHRDGREADARRHRPVHRDRPRPALGLARGQVDVDENGYVVVDHPSTRTNLTGVFASGDLVDHHYRQAITAAGTGSAAALDAERYLAALDHAASSAGSAGETEHEADLLTEQVQTAGA